MNKNFLFILLFFLCTHTSTEPCAIVFAPVALAQYVFDPTSENNVFITCGETTTPTNVGCLILATGLIAAALIGANGLDQFIAETLKDKPDSKKTRRYAKQVLLAAGIGIVTPFAAITGARITSKIINYRKPIIAPNT